MILGNQDRVIAPRTAIHSGPWAAELRNDELAAISYNGIQALRAIRAVVRDKDWRTLVPTVQDSTLDEGEWGTELNLNLAFNGFGVRYTGRLTIRFEAESLLVSFEGIAPEDFLSNRIGLVVLHRPEEAGLPVGVGTTAGQSINGRFPVDISPHQPFMDIESMEWERDGAQFHLGFAGDVFETEDQRNWTDASFKTYSTPLSEPFPVHVRAGTRVQQSIRLSAAARANESTIVPQAHNRMEMPRVLDTRIGVVPALTVASSTTAGWVAGGQQRIPGLEALLVEITAGPAAAEHLAHAVEQAGTLGVPLDVRLVVEAAHQVAGMVQMLPLAKVLRLAVFDTRSHLSEPALWAELLAAAGELEYQGELVAGTRAHFTELNRGSESLPANAPSWTYSVTPQMHASEVPHIVETLPMQRLTADNALRLTAGRPVHVGPVTLKPRFNAVATTAGQAAMAEVDTLQTEPFAAAWLLGSVVALTMPGISSLSYFELAGPGGITQGTQLTPAGEMLAVLASLRGKPVLQVTGNSGDVVVYAVQDGTHTVILAANLSDKPIRTHLGLDNGSTLELDLAPWSTTTKKVKETSS
ncbi:hypothetical protein ACIPWF_19640 [Paenarthrobacter sp. NPDC089989]|uniref:hypothetical protein n=1 Tax=unclassified Paenarthrobacter TaxID=2634190 RepID=UPI00380455DD